MLPEPRPYKLGQTKYVWKCHYDCFLKYFLFRNILK